MSNWNQPMTRGAGLSRFGPAGACGEGSAPHLEPQQSPGHLNEFGSEANLSLEPSYFPYGFMAPSLTPVPQSVNQDSY